MHGRPVLIISDVRWGGRLSCSMCVAALAPAKLAHADLSDSELESCGGGWRRAVMHDAFFVCQPLCCFWRRLVPSWAASAMCSTSGWPFSGSRLPMCSRGQGMLDRRQSSGACVAPQRSLAARSLVLGWRNVVNEPGSRSAALWHPIQPKGRWSLWDFP